MTTTPPPNAPQNALYRDLTWRDLPTVVRIGLGAFTANPWIVVLLVLAGLVIATAGPWLGGAWWAILLTAVLFPLLILVLVSLLPYWWRRSGGHTYLTDYAMLTIRPLPGDIWEATNHVAFPNAAGPCRGRARHGRDLRNALLTDWATDPNLAHVTVTAVAANDVVERLYAAHGFTLTTATTTEQGNNLVRRRWHLPFRDSRSRRWQKTKPVVTCALSNMRRAEQSAIPGTTQTPASHRASQPTAPTVPYRGAAGDWTSPDSPSRLAMETPMTTAAILAVHPDGTTSRIDLTGHDTHDLTTLQTAVGGYLQDLRLPEDWGYMLVNEDGLRAALPPNPAATRLVKQTGIDLLIQDNLVGTVLFGSVSAGGAFTSATPTLLAAARGQGLDLSGWPA